MADQKPSATGSSPAPSAPPPSPPKRNPAFRMMGLPNISLKLPSRNWLIFLSLSGALTSAILYDRHYKKKAQQKWCRLVSHISREPLQPNTMPRKLTVFLSAPPGDSLKASRDYFNEYVKPMLVAGALDWEVVEGRREGEVRAGLAEKIRKLRKSIGEVGPREAGETEPAPPDQEEMLKEIRHNAGIKEWPDMKGDIVIGRHTWKEYIRGLHEGWLGPLEPPPPPPSPSPPEENPISTPPSPPPSEEPSSTETPAEEKLPAEPPKPPAKPSPTPAFIPPSLDVYTSTTLPTSLLNSNPIQPSSPLPHPHVLGFLNTPTRFWRFLNRRHLADQIGRETAAIVLAAHTRPYDGIASSSSSSSSHPYSSSSDSPVDDDASPTLSTSEALSAENSLNAHELHLSLAHEEDSWHKSVRKRSPPDQAGVELERVWLDEIVLDPRIASRMRRFELAAEEEARAGRIAEGKEKEKDYEEAREMDE
ncbi:MAG: mitochondrial import inner membrane translocase subunit tim54 [Sclerophora amabilis]|nr:MAG: mitochondrial import inner membrane translocase subunit tim54 [Sclerophora amabilis]